VVTAFLMTFGLALLASVLFSALASRSPLSNSAVFLVAGVVAGPLLLDVVSVPQDTVESVAEVALFAVLFTDGQHASLGVLRRSGLTAARPLVVAMPLTFAVVAVLAHYLTGLPWGPSLVLGAILAPTDPVFASALVGREDVPRGVREVLNIESGLNDGLALPAVLIIAGTVGAHPHGYATDWPSLVLELGLGVVLGVVVPLLVVQLLRLPGVGVIDTLQPLGPLSLAVLLFALCDVLDANRFLAAFIAGATIATIRPGASNSFRHTGELISEMVKGAALLAFAVLLDRHVFAAAGWSGLLLAVAVVLLSRPLPVWLCLLGSELTRRERIAAAWFGPKGFASVAYGLIIAFSGMPYAGEVLALTAVVVLVSVLAHSSTDVTVAKWWTDPSEDLRSAERPGPTVIPSG
jgi:NhaP-type Na+/H+ or K+/H+ antiporter